MTKSLQVSEEFGFWFGCLFRCESIGPSRLVITERTDIPVRAGSELIRKAVPLLESQVGDQVLYSLFIHLRNEFGLSSPTQPECSVFVEAVINQPGRSHRFRFIYSPHYTIAYIHKTGTIEIYLRTREAKHIHSALCQGALNSNGVREAEVRSKRKPRSKESKSQCS